MMRSSLYAIHGENDLDYSMRDEHGIVLPGWEIRTEELGHDPNHAHGTDYRGARHAVIARLNNGYKPNGTIPEPQHYEAFAQRVANFVAGSQGCTRWIIGNEMNHADERPKGVTIWPWDYAECYELCRNAIHALAGHERDEVLVGAVAPWNPQTSYRNNEHGDWIQYFQDVQKALTSCDGFAIHAYARAQEPGAIRSMDKMSGAFSDRFWGFQVYTEWMDAIEARFAGLPVYLTEFDMVEPWQNRNSGVVRQAYQEIDTWNHLHPDRLISCLAVYRWQHDRWTFRDKPEVIRDFMEAVGCGYTVPPLSVPVEPEPEPETPTCDHWRALDERILQLEARVDRVERVCEALLQRIEAGAAGLVGG